MNINEELIKNEDKIKILWQGNDGFIFYKKDIMFATDLDLYNIERKYKPTVDINMLYEKLNYLFITHSHEDHFNTETINDLAENGKCEFIIPLSCKEKFLKLNIDEKRVHFVKPFDALQLNGLYVKCKPAIHGHLSGSVYSGASLSDCGYLFEFFGKKIYEPGDTLLLEEHFNMKDEKIDLLFVSPTEHNTNVENSLKLIELLSPEKIIMQHFNTYGEAEDNLFWSHGYVNELYENMDKSTKLKTVIPNQNELYKL